MLLALLACALAPASQRPVTVSVEVGRADGAVAALGKAAGVPMQADEPVASEIVFLKVDRLPLQDVMAALARVTCADWARRADGSYLLQRSPARADVELKKEEDRKLAVLAAWRNGLVKGLKIRHDMAALRRVEHEKAQLEIQLDKGPEAQRTEAWKRLDELEKAELSYRALARCLQGVDLRPAAEMLPYASVVFATNPNKLQRALPPASALPSDGRPARILVIVWHPDERYYRIHLRILDESARDVLYYAPDEVWTEPAGPRVPPLGAASPASNVKPSAETAALWERMRLHPNAPKVKQAVAKLRRFFNDPVHNDPLWLGNQELLTALAHVARKSVIACLPDSARCDYCDKLSVADYPTAKATVWRERPDWIELWPQSFAEDWAHRADRKAMAACVEAFRTRGKIDLIDYVRLVGRFGNAGEGSFGGTFVELVDPDYLRGYQSFHLPMQWAFLELLANLSTPQIALLKTGGTIPYADLSPAQRSAATRIVYGSRVNYGMYGRPPTRLGEVDPTFELPGGLPAGAGLSADASEDTIAVFHNGLGGDRDWITQVNLDRPSGGGWSGPGPRLPRGGMKAATVTFHRQFSLTLKCALSPGHYLLDGFNEPLGKPDGPPVVFTKLPDAMQKKLWPLVRGFDEFGTVGRGPDERRSGGE